MDLIQEFEGLYDGGSGVEYFSYDKSIIQFINDSNDKCRNAFIAQVELFEEKVFFLFCTETGKDLLGSRSIFFR